MKKLEELSKTELIAELRELREMQQSIVENATEKSASEIKLQESEEKFRILYNNSLDMYASVSPDDATIILCNDTLLQATAYSREEVVGSPIFKMYHDDCMADARKAFGQFVEAGEVKNKELILKRKDGGKIAVSLNVYGIRDEAGKLIYSMSWRDITEQKQAEQALIANEKRYKKAQIIAGAGNWEYNLETLQFWASEEAKRIFGFEQDAFDFTTEEVESFIPERERVHKTLIDLIEKDKEYNIEYDIITKDTGERKTIQSIAELEKNNEGKAVMVSGVVIDITLLKEKTAKLKDSEEKFRALYDNAPLSYQSLNEDGSVKDVNPAWLNTLGYRREEVIDHSFFDLLHPESRLKAKHDIFPNFKSCGLITGVEFKIRHKIGHYLYISYEGCIGYHADGSFKQTYCVFQDITEKKKVEQELIESEERFRSIVEQSPLSTQIFTPDGMTTQVNCAYENLWGIRLEDLKGYNILEDQQLVSLGIMSYIQTAFSGEAVSIPIAEYDTVKSFGKGKKSWIQARIYPVKDNAGNIDKIILIHEDITERKQAEKDLKVSELKYRNQANFLDVVAESSSFAMWVSDAKGTIIRSNQALRDILNISDEMIIGKYNVLQDESIYAQGFMADVEAVFNNFKSTRFSMFWTGIKAENVDLSKANERWIDVSMFAITDEAGKLMNVVCQYLDITDRKQAEKALEESEKHYRTLFNDSPVPLWEEDLTDLLAYLLEIKEKGDKAIRIYFENNPDELMKCAKMVKVIDVNQATLDLYMATSKEQLIGNVDKTFTENSFSVFIEELITIIEGNKIFESEAEVKTLSGDLKHIFLTLKIDQSQPDKVKALLATSDITERKLAKDELVKHQEHLEELVRERTKNLEEKNKELERFNNLFVDREFRIKELRDELASLKSDK